MSRLQIQDLLDFIKKKNLTQLTMFLSPATTITTSLQVFQSQQAY